MRVPICAAGLLAGLAAASAQTLPTPSAEREPNPAAVQREERAMGIAPTPQQQRREAAAENQLFRELTGQNPKAPGSAAPPAPLHTPSQDAQATEQLLRQLLPPGTPGR